MLKQTIKMAAAGSASVSLLFMGGIASAHQQNNQKHDKDPGTVTICVASSKNVNVVNNFNSQTAKTGKVKVSGNDTGGSATSGKASNDNNTGITFDNSNTGNCPPAAPVQAVQVSGGGSGGGTLTVQVTKNANVNIISNASVQSATSGSASVVCNTQGGSATSGPASNGNATTIMVTSANN